MALPHEKYTTNEYLNENPSWDIEDSAWKAQNVVKILKKNRITPQSICDVGCGAGGVLTELRRSHSQTELYGYDIAPGTASFWPAKEKTTIQFYLGDFFDLNAKKYDLLLLLDVIEHLTNPFSFLDKLLNTADYFVFHIPLDLSMINILREKPIMQLRRRVGHIHYFTKGLALSLLHEAGYEIIDWSYSNAAFNSPQRTWKTKLASIPRVLAYFLNKDLGVRILGGETLFVLCKPYSCKKK